MCVCLCWRCYATKIDVEMKNLSGVKRKRRSRRKKNWINNFFSSLVSLTSRFCLKFKIKVNFFTYIHPLKIKGITRSDSVKKKTHSVVHLINENENERARNERAQKIRVSAWEMQWSGFEGDRQRWHWYMLWKCYTSASVEWACKGKECKNERERRRQM